MTNFGQNYLLSICIDIYNPFVYLPCQNMSLKTIKFLVIFIANIYRGQIGDRFNILLRSFINDSFSLSRKYSVIKVAIKHCGLSPIFFGRVDLLSRQYSDLEDEFRMALQIEANRFKEVRQSLQSATDRGQPIQRGKAVTAERYRSRPTDSKR